MAVMLSSLAAAEDEAQRVEEARKVVQEYEWKQKAIAAAALVSASLLIEEHESGKKIAEASELAKARDIVRKREERVAQERERAIDAIPTLVVVRRDSKWDLGRIFNVANREVIRRRIAQVKAHIDRSDQEFTERSRKELPQLEVALQEMKDVGKPLGGTYATVFEADDKFVVAYFDSMSFDHFVCLVRKNDYSSLPADEARTWIASNLTQKDIIVE